MVEDEGVYFSSSIPLFPSSYLPTELFNNNKLQKLQKGKGE